MKENSEKKYIKILGLIFLAILFCLLVLKVVKEGIFAKNFGINLAIVGDSSTALLILRPDEDILGLVKLPSRLKVKIYNSAAQYPIGSLWEYGVSERRPYEIFEKSLGLSMGVAISRTIRVTGEASIESVLADLHKLNLKTDLSIRDRFLIRQYLVDSMASQKVLEMDIPGNAFDKVEEPDGKEFLVFNNVISLWTKNKFLMESLLNENADVSINNLSGLAGFGIAISRQLESAGIRVIEVKTDPNKDISGNGCVFATWGNYPISENFLIYQIGCERRKMNESEEEKGIDVWLK